MVRHRAGFHLGIGYDLNYLNNSLFSLDDKGSSSWSLGGVYEYQYSDRIAFRSGLSYDRSGGSVSDNPADTVRANYYDVMPFVFHDQVLSLNEAQNSIDLFYVTAPGLYSLSARKYHFNQFTVPLEIYFRTRMKDFRRFYVKTGVHIGLLFRAGADDYSFSETGFQYPKNDVFFKDINTFQPEFTFGFGGEWAFVGRTTFFTDVEADLPLRNYFKQDPYYAAYFARGVNTFGYINASDLGDVPAENNNFYQLHFRVKMGFIF
jgi:hypothetical protein